MSRLGWFRRLIVAAALSGPLVIAAEPAAADRRHDDRYGRRHDHHRHYDRHHRHRRHHGSGLSGLFIFDFGPPPPPRRVYVQPPPVVYQAPPPVLYQTPPPVVYRAAPQAYCREYTTTMMVGGRPVETYGTACMQPDGTWRIVSMN